MSEGGFRVAADLPAMASSMRSASDRIERAAGGCPQAPDAGAATSTLAGIMATLLASAGNLSMDALEAADRLDESHAAYAEVDERVATSLPSGWGH